MSGYNIDRKLNNAFGKVGRILGYEFAMYRSVDYLNPVQDKNYVKQVQMAFSIDESFTKAQGFGFSLYNLYLNEDIQDGDIFVAEMLNKRFTVVQDEVITTPYGINSFGLITISRPTYDNVGGFGPKETQIAVNIPATVLEISSGSRDGADNSPYKAGIQRWDMWAYLPHDLIKLHDSVVDHNGNKSTINSVQYTPLGYKITTVSTKK